MRGMLDLSRFPGRVVATRHIPPRPARTVPIPSSVHPGLRGALIGRGIEALYQHQVEAFEASRAGQDVVLTTGTASGKSLAYLLPVLQAVLEDPSSRALLLFPTKALTQDQLRGVLAVIEDILVGGGVAANSRLRVITEERAAKHGIRVRVPRPGLCTDNGAMVAALGAELVARGREPSRLDLPADSSQPITQVVA